MGSFAFSKEQLECLVGGRSVLDLPHLSVHSSEEAGQFLLSYGYDLRVPDHVAELWRVHRRAIDFISEYLLRPGEALPSELSDRTKLSDLTKLLVIASSREPGNAHLQRKACAILRVMHVFVHIRNDLFQAFREEIQSQILQPFQATIQRHSETNGLQLGDGGGAVRLVRFDVKPLKTTASSVIKLLARPDRVTMTLLDKIGIRLVTESVYEAFRLLRYLLHHSVLSFPHVMPDQSSNSMYPLNLFIETMEELEQAQAKATAISSELMNGILRNTLEDHSSRAEYRRRPNQFSGPDHRFIKFIDRKLVTARWANPTDPKGPLRSIRFFYPYEVQIMDEASFNDQLRGPSAHTEYKRRQRLRARERVFGVTSEAL